MIIINADDFGKDRNTNAAVLECFKHEWISSASIMANMPGFFEACQMTQDYNLVNKIGIHLVLTEGLPLTEKIKTLPRFCDPSGVFILKRNRRVLALNQEEKDALSIEIIAQIKRCQSCKLPLTHFDSHHHMHEEWGILKLVMPILKNYGIPHIRILNNLHRSETSKSLYRTLINFYLRLWSKPRSVYFGTAIDYRNASQRVYRASIKNSVEIMTHPTLDTFGSIVESTNGETIESLSMNLISNIGKSVEGHNPL